MVFCFRCDSVIKPKFHHILMEIVISHNIKPIDPARPTFIGEVSGIDPVSYTHLTLPTID
jgi:hypothetical protein